MFREGLAVVTDADNEDSFRFWLELVLANPMFLLLRVWLLVARLMGLQSAGAVVSRGRVRLAGFFRGCGVVWGWMGLFADECVRSRSLGPRGPRLILLTASRFGSRTRLLEMVSLSRTRCGGLLGEWVEPDRVGRVR